MPPPPCALQENPGVPVVENLEDLWMVSRLQRERKTKEDADKARRLQARQGWRWCVYACVCWGLGWGGAGVFLRFQAGWAW